MKILVIDDDLSTRQQFERILGVIAEVQAAASGRHGLSKMAQEPFDVIVCDLNLPDLTGINIVRELRACGISTPVIIVTGYATTADAINAFRLGVTDFIEKPVFPEALLAAVSTVADRRDSGAHSLVHIDHVATRWARLLVPVVYRNRDTRTQAAWAKWIGMSQGAIKTRCAAVGVTPRRSLILARLLRVARRAPETSVEQMLDVVDRRTVTSLVMSAGASAGRVTAFPLGIDGLLTQQQLVTQQGLLTELRRILAIEDLSASHVAAYSYESTAAERD